MKRAAPAHIRTLRNIMIGCLLAGIAGGISGARAHDDDDYYRDSRWREHQRQEQIWQARRDRQRREHWDHRYWDRDRDAYYYRPPAVIYDYPRLPPSLGFEFRVR